MAPKSAFVFSYNAQDADVATLAETSRHVHAGLGITHTRARVNGRDDDEDDWVPTYGPTTRRKGKMRFVPAKDPQFQVIPGYQDAIAAPVEENAEEDTQAAAIESPASKGRGSTIPGAAVRSLYASIVGLGKPPTAAASLSEPVSRRVSPPRAAPSDEARGLGGPFESYPSRKKRPRTASPPLEHSRWRTGSARNVDIVLSSDSETDDVASEAVETREAASPAAQSRSGRHSTESDADITDDNDDEEQDVIVLDPLTGLPETKTSGPGQAPKRLQALLIHQLLPRASDTDAAVEPFVPPTQYAIKPDSPGWRLLTRQGWREGLPLGPVVSIEGGALAGTEGGVTAGSSGSARLKVPLRAVEKHDRSGIGVPKAPEDRVIVGALNSEHAQRAREDRERERRRAERDARDRRGKGERGMERQRKKEERERKAWIAYMNR